MLIFHFVFVLSAYTLMPTNFKPTFHYLIFVSAIGAKPGENGEKKSVTADGMPYYCVDFQIFSSDHKKRFVKNFFKR